MLGLKEHVTKRAILSGLGKHQLLIMMPLLLIGHETLRQRFVIVEKTLKRQRSPKTVKGIPTSDVVVVSSSCRTCRLRGIA